MYYLEVYFYYEKTIFNVKCLWFTSVDCYIFHEFKSLAKIVSVNGYSFMLMVIINTGLPVGTKGRNSLGFTLKQKYNQNKL